MASVYVLKKLLDDALVDAAFRERLLLSPVAAGLEKGLRVSVQEAGLLTGAAELLRSAATELAQAREWLGLSLVMDGCFPICLPLNPDPHPPKLALDWTPRNRVQTEVAGVLRQPGVDAAQAAQRMDQAAATLDQEGLRLEASQLRAVAEDVRRSGTGLPA